MIHYLPPLLLIFLLWGCGAVKERELQVQKELQKYKRIVSMERRTPPPPQKPKPLPPREEPDFLKKRVSINLHKVPLKDAVKTLTYLTNTNIYLDRDIELRADLFLVDATLKEALDALCDQFGFSYEIKGKSVKIVTYKTAILKLFVPASMRSVSSLVTSAAATGDSTQSGEAQLSINNQLKIDIWEGVKNTLQRIIADEERTSVQIAFTRSISKSLSQTASQEQKGAQENQRQKSYSQGEADSFGKSIGSQSGKSFSKEEGNPLKKASKEIDFNKILPKKSESDSSRAAERWGSMESKSSELSSISSVMRNFSKNRQKQEQESSNSVERVSVSRSLDYKPFVEVDRLSGLIVVKARPKTIEKIEEYVQTLNKLLNREIMVDLEIVEFINTKNFTMGVDWKKLIDDVQLLDSDGIMKISQKTAPDTGMVELTFRGADFQAFLTALSAQGYTRVISSPRITTLNNQPAVIKVGSDRILIYNKVQYESTTTQNVSNTVSSVDVQKMPIISEGLTLYVLPRYNEESREVILNIIPILQKLQGKSSTELDQQLSNMVIADPSRFQTKPVPLTIETKQLNAIAKLKEDEVLVLGGISSEIDDDSAQGVPLLSEIPILQNLFRQKKLSKVKSYLILLLRVKYF
ncbi:MAG: hypothetical protein GXO19_01580 [Epsilonproteobacteria bacterium]|nr:hypothetical protein [Campylobacterota bacterium]NPA56406.1 hypothetical protein [Campylobacterota bacterium]